jgi:pilus assembly protein Flp/PilA
MPDLLKALHCRIWTMATRDEDGQALIEYALVLALIALVTVVALEVLGGGVKGAFNSSGHGI